MWKLKGTKIVVIANYKNWQLNQYQDICFCNNLKLKRLKLAMFMQRPVLQCLIVMFIFTEKKNHIQHLSVFLVK